MYKSKDIRLDNLKPETGERIPTPGNKEEPGIESLNQWGKERERMVERKGSTSRGGLLKGGIGGILKPSPVVLGDKEDGRGGVVRVGSAERGGFLAPVVLGK